MASGCREGKSMSSVSIIERIRILADQLESGESSVQEVADSVLGLATALEGVDRARIKEVTHFFWIRTGQHEEELGPDAVVGFLRRWTEAVSQDSN